MQLVFSDAQYWEDFLPLTFTRPVAEMRCGILTFSERWQKILENTEVSFFTENYLQGKFMQINDDSGYVHINKYIDTLPMVMNWEMDTFIIAVGTAGFAIIFTGLLVYLSLIFGITYLILNEKIKETKYKNYMIHILYMLGLKSPKTKADHPEG